MYCGRCIKSLWSNSHHFIANQVKTNYFAQVWALYIDPAKYIPIHTKGTCLNANTEGI